MEEEKRHNWTVRDLLEYPPPKTIKWNLWSKDLSNEEKQVIELMRNQVTKELKEIGVFLEIIVQPVPEGKTIWGDYGTSLIDEIHSDPKTSWIIFEPRLNPDEKRFYSLLDPDFYMHHHLKSKEERKRVFEILSKYFSLDWNKSNKNAIGILGLKH